MRNFHDLLRGLPVDNADDALEELAQRIVRQGMGAAAIVFLESAKPFSFIAGQTAIVATPLLGSFIEPMRLERYAGLFGNRDFVERLIRRIEELEDQTAATRGNPPARGESEGK